MVRVRILLYPTQMAPIGQEEEAFLSSLYLAAHFFKELLQPALLN